MATIDKEYYRYQLIEYLRSTKYLRNADEQKVQKFVEAIENDLLEVIRTNQHVDLQDVYEFIDKEALGELINLTNRGRSLAAQNVRCFVLVDLKTDKITYEDVGQMDMYRKMYDDQYRLEGHNPTFGIILCTDTDADIARYSTLNGNDHLFQAKYMLYMPTKEQIKLEIERKKELYRLQRNEELKALENNINGQEDNK